MRKLFPAEFAKYLKERLDYFSNRYNFAKEKFAKLTYARRSYYNQNPSARKQMRAWARDQEISGYKLKRKISTLKELSR